MEIADYLGKNISELLIIKPYINWEFEYFIDEDILEPEVNYIFNGHGLIVNCDIQGCIRTFFLYLDDYGGAEQSLTEIQFSFTREQVLKYFRIAPDKSGDGFVDPILGEYGGHDRFHFSNRFVHIEYKPKKNEIKMITFMKDNIIS